MKHQKAHRSHSSSNNRQAPFFKKGSSGFFPKKSAQAAPIQKKGDKKPAQAKDESAQAPPQFSKWVADILKKQLSDKSLQAHLKKLGKKLQGLALKSTEETTNQPQGAAERMAALGVADAFEQSSKDILKDPGLKYLRKLIVDRVGDSPELALATALAGLLLVLGTGSEIDAELGKGFGLGGALKVGIKDGAPDFEKIKTFASYAHTYFGAKIGGEVRQEQKDKGNPEKQLLAEASGEIRLGPKHTGFKGTILLDTNRQLKLTGRLSADILTLSRGGKKGNSLSLFTEVEHTRTPDGNKTIIQPGVSAKFKWGAGHSLQFGAGATFSADKGFQTFTGAIEYRYDRIRLTFDAGLPGIAPDKSLFLDSPTLPGNNMQLQGMLTIYFK